MRLFLSIFVSFIAITITAVYQHDTLDEYMQSLFGTKTLNTLSKNLKQNSKTVSSMASQSTFVGLPVIPPSDPSLNASSPKPRGIQNVLEAREQSEGAGARVRRSIGTPGLRNLSPFLMCTPPPPPSFPSRPLPSPLNHVRVNTNQFFCRLDHFNTPVGAGFPDHPHRGQETITYLLGGAADHEDFAGNKGTLWPGDLQFMTAGRGIVHAEMPHDSGDGVPNTGMQLWVDLPKDLKNCEPRYRDLRAAEIPIAEADDGKVTVKVISGQSYGVDSVQELAYTPVWLLDVTIRPGGRIAQSLPAGWNVFAYTFEGTTIFDTGVTKQEVKKFHNTVFEQKGDQVIAEVPADAEEAARFILVAGLPLDQPIVQYGPFVLTDASQVKQAMMDYSTYTNGFERAEGWQSEIGRSLM